MQAESNVVGTDEEEPGFLVRITGFSTQTTEDALLNFFENTRRSGGGEIKEIQLSQDEGFTDIVFWHNEDARRVAQNDGLQLDGANLAATLKKIPKERPVDQRRLHVLGISDKTTKDGLISFMEVVSGEEVESISFGSHSNGMVCFKETIDLHEVQKMCKTNSLDENSLKVEEVKTCDCIEVTGFACNTTKDAILYYFKNKRKGGGDIKNFEEIESPERKMLVSFEDPKVVDNVMNQQDHVIDGAHLTVNRYYSFLGETSLTNPKGDRKKERIVSVDPKSMLFIEEFFGEELSQLLQECRVKYTWQEDSREIVLGCAEPKMDKTTWENSCDAVVSYINQIVTEKIYTTQEIWEQMRDKAKEKGVAFENEMQILYTFDFKKNLSIQLRGKKTSVGVLAKQLQDFIAQIEKEILLEKSKITKKITLSEAQMDLLSFCGFVEDLKNGHQGLEVTMTNDSNEQAIQLRGQEDEVNEGNIAVWQALSNEKESEIELPKSIISILRSETGKVFIATNFKNNNVEAVVGFDTRSDTIIVTAVDRNNLKNAIDFIKEVTAEEGIPLDTEQKQLIGSNKWKELMHSIQDSMLLRATEDPESSMLLLAGIKQEVETAKEKVEEFFDENLISNKVIDAETGRVKFIFKFNLVAIKDIEDALKKYSVKLVKKSDERSGNVVVSGTRKGIEQAVPKAEMLINNVKDRIVAIDATVLREIDQGKEWLEFLDGMENKYNCVIERLTEPRSMYDSLNVGPLGSELEKVDKLKLQVFAADTIVVQKIEDEINGFLEDNRKVAKDVLSRRKCRKVPLTVVEDMPFSDKAHGKPYQEEYELLDVFEGSWNHCFEAIFPLKSFITSQEGNCSSVIVSGLSSNTTQDAIQMYFENSRRSSGGDVKSVELDGDQAIVTFESPEVAKRVLEWSKHTLDGCPLTVTRPVQPKKTSSLNEEKEESEKPVQRSKVVRVQGISDTTTKDALLNFFENTRRSAGGEIEDIQHIPDERMADITFCSPDDAERVSQKQDLKLHGCRLTVTLKEIPKEIPKDPNKLHVMGISEKTTKNGLISFMEVVSGEEVESVLFGSNSNVMVTFKEPPDLEKVQKKCSRRALDCSHLKIEQVNICDCIEVTGLTSNTTKDTLFFYFDNPRNGGGEVKSVEMDLENARAMLFFDEPSVVNNVTRQEHIVNGTKVEVAPYYPFLSKSSNDPKVMKIKVVKEQKKKKDTRRKFVALVTQIQHT